MYLSDLKKLVAAIEADITHPYAQTPDPRVLIEHPDRGGGYLELRPARDLSDDRVFAEEDNPFSQGGDYIISTGPAPRREGY